MSSFFDSASLVQIPSGYSDGTLYSVKPIDGTGDLTFSRGSDIEATRVASNGYIEKAKVNLAIQSNSFSTSWSVTNATLTSGQSGYDGSSDAWSLLGSGSNARVDISNTSTGLLTFSVYAKAGTSDFFRMRVDYGAAYVDRYFDLSSGTLGGSFFTPIDSKIEAVGASGWYRCSITLSQSISTIRIYAADVNLGGSASGNIYIQDAQLNYGLVAQEYQETTTTSVVSGITNDMPRLDYSGGASCPSLLLEPSRQNLIPQSEYIAGYTLVNVTAVSNDATSPEGVSNATKIVEDSANTNKHFRAANTTLTASTYSVSTFVKPNNCDVIALREGLVSGDAITYKFSTGTSSLQGTRWGATSLKVEEFSGGWYRISANFTATSATAHNFRIHILGNDFNQTTNPSVGTYTYLGDGASGGWFYGFQCEAGSYPTSYIPTYGTSNSRNSESCSKTGISSLIGQASGSVVVDLDLSVASVFEHLFNVFDSTNTESILVYLRSTNRIRFAATGTSNYDDVEISSGRHKVAVVWDGSNITYFRDGSKLITRTGFAKTLTFSDFYLGNRTAADENPEAAHQVLLFTSALSDADAITLTTL